jgi:hypothetical protein
MHSLLWFIAFLLLLGVELVLPCGFYFACLALGTLTAGPEPHRLKPLTGIRSLWIPILRFMALAMPIVALASPLRAAPVPGFLSAGAIGSLSLPAGDARYNWSISNGSLLLGQGTSTISFQAGRPGPLDLTGDPAPAGGPPMRASFIVLPEPRAEIFAPARAHLGDRFAVSMPEPFIRACFWNPVTGAGSSEPSGNPMQVTATATGTIRISGTVEDLAGASASASATVEVVQGDFANPGGVMAERGRDSAVRLPSGRVLVLGEDRQAGLFDPASNAWRSAAPMREAHGQGHTATLLASGKVLVAGGKGPDGTLAGAECYDPATGQWTEARAMIQARSGHSATLLRDGSVLVLGGEDEQGGLLAEPESYDPETGRWTLLTPVAITPPAARVHHTATLLDNGMVLILGGAGADGEALRSAELYDPASAAWWPAAQPRAARARHSATLLEDGSVLAAGGFAGASQLASAERYAPARDTWTAAASLGAPRDGHGAARLIDGGVLVMGGEAGEACLATAERYDPGLGPGQGDGWTTQPPLLLERAQPCATTLADGRVLVTGGWNLRGDLGSPELLSPGAAAWAAAAGGDARARSGHTATLLGDGSVLMLGGSTGDGAEAQRFAPGTQSWSQAGHPLARSRTNHSATLLPDGSVLVAGGLDDQGHLLTAAERYDPESGLWAGAGALAMGRVAHTAVLLADGTVLVAGGLGDQGFLPLDTAERFDGGLWVSVAPLATARFGHSATRMADGTVLVVGGQDGDGAALASAERFDPDTGAWATLPGALATPRTGHSATLLPDGRIIVVGGFRDGLACASVECFDPVRQLWSPAASLRTARGNHTATLVDGKLLVIGGSDLRQELAGAELYDPATNSWSAGGTMDAPRASHSATLLQDGATVAVYGGEPLQANLEFWQ